MCIEVYRCYTGSRVWHSHMKSVQTPTKIKRVKSDKHLANELLSARGNGNDTISYRRGTTNDIRSQKCHPRELFDEFHDTKRQRDPVAILSAVCEYV